ncbi:MAG: hypothetical protein M3Y81_09980 [Chloroflexota bacterium]|nr:hypothetical protein [Chloroflexota bacterium]
MDQIFRFFPMISSRYEGVSYQHLDGLIEGGFAFRVAAVAFYGQQVEGIVKSLAMKVPGEGTGKATEIASALRSVMATYHLCLLDWCKPQIITAHTELLETFLKR